MKKAIKVIGVILATLAAIILIPSLFFPSTFTANSTIVIQSNAYTVYPIFADLRNWEQWSPWKALDTSATYTYSANTYGAGSTMSWESKNPKVGTGKLTTVQFKKYHHIHYKLEFFKPFKSTSTGVIEIQEKEDNQVEVTWTNTGKLRWPVDRWMDKFVNFKKSFDESFATGLASLKKVAESSPQKNLPNINPELVNLDDILIFAIMKYNVSNDSISSEIGKSYMSIMHSVQISKARLLEQPPLCLFYRHSSQTSDIQPGLIVQGCLPLETEVACRPLKAGPTLKIRYTGPYSNMETTYDAIDIYMASNNFQKRENYTWESYVTDPGLEPDSTKWITDIYIPVKGLVVPQEISNSDSTKAP